MKFSILGLSIRLYGVIIAFGVLLALGLARLREKRFDLPKDTALDLVLWVLPIAILGARLYYVLFSWEYYADEPVRALYIWEGGLAIYGGLIAGIFTMFVFAKRRRLPFSTLTDLFAPCVALGQAIGRWGNFVNGEAYGAATSLAFFPISVFIRADGQWHYATFFYESLWCLLICLFLLMLEKRNAFKRSGDESLTYAMLYAFERFWVEALRTDSLYIGQFRVSRLLSAAIFLTCAVVLIYRRKRVNK